jgi:hypothetical protein
MKKSQLLAKQLRPLTPLDNTTLVRVAGGQMASTSTSGTPAAGDDTIGDRDVLGLDRELLDASGDTAPL